MSEHNFPAPKDGDHIGIEVWVQLPDRSLHPIKIVQVEYNGMKGLMKIIVDPTETFMVVSLPEAGHA